MSKLLVILPGGFHPYHAGHYALYQSAKKAFPNAEVYVAATNDQSERPFPFALKEKLAKLAGVEPGHFIQVKSPFQAREITSNYNPEEDVLVFVRSEKDRNESPQPGGTKKDGSPAYFQPWTGKNVQPFNKHAYMAYLPTVEFGPGITSATQIRKAWPTLNDKRKTALVMSLYPKAQANPKLAQNVVGMFDQVMNPQSINEASGKSSDSLLNEFYVRELSSEQQVINYVRKCLIPEMRRYNVPINMRTYYPTLSSAVFEGVSKVISSGKDFYDIFKRLDQRNNLKIAVGQNVSILNLRMAQDFAEIFGFKNPKKITKIYREPTDNKIVQIEFNNDPEDVWPRMPLASYNGKLIMTSAFFSNAKAVEQALLTLKLSTPEDIKVNVNVMEMDSDRSISESDISKNQDYLEEK
jgi:hypothetical protein